jgi:hypothetical protein
VPLVTVPSPLVDLTAAELAALRGAALWYANYHASAVAGLAGDTAAYAVEERGQYLDLVAALGKLGVRVRLPDALLDSRVRAA